MFDQKALKKVFHGLDADLGIVQVQLGYISLWYDQIFHRTSFFRNGKDFEFLWPQTCGQNTSLS